MARPKSDLAPRIVDAARRRFLLEGVDGASLRQIASDAGTNIGMIYYYFPTKDDLFEAILDHVYTGFLADLEKALAPDVPPEDRFPRMYARIAAMSEIEFETVRLVVREAMISSARLSRIAARFFRGHLPRMLETIAEARASNRFDPDLPIPVELGSAMVLAVFPQIILRLVRNSELPMKDMLPTSEEAAKYLAHVLLHGIGGPALPSRKSGD